MNLLFFSVSAYEKETERAKKSKLFPQKSFIAFFYDHISGVFKIIHLDGLYPTLVNI